jgi:ribosomal protein S18 acetylase RimI-like enzyme
MARPVVTTRAATDDDGPLLLDLFLSGEAGAWAALVPRVDSRPVLQRMFVAQQAEYARRYPHARHDIILIDGESAGQVRWIEIEDEVYVIDIALLPRCRRRGAATSVYRTILAHAQTCGKPVRATVTRLNAASVALHERLGFVVEHENETHLFLTTGSMRTGTGGE